MEERKSAALTATLASPSTSTMGKVFHLDFFIKNSVADGIREPVPV
jgi:hypothetical protein